MTLEIKVCVTPEDVNNGGAATYIDRAMSALGFTRANSEPLRAAVIESIKEKQEIIDQIKAEEPAPKKAGRRKKEEPQISTGAERVGPEDTPETQAQDAADEAEESAATKTGLTLDDLRQAVGRYQKRFGMAAATKDIPNLLGKPMAEVTDDELPRLIQKIDDVGIENVAAPKAEIGNPITASPPATKDDVKEAMLRYAEKFDGTRDPMQAEKTKAAMPAIFAAICGSAVSKLSDVPADKYAAVIVAIDEAIAKNG